jgi:hypothetical protein
MWVAGKKKRSSRSGGGNWTFHDVGYDKTREHMPTYYIVLLRTKVRIDTPGYGSWNVEARFLSWPPE